MTHPESKVEALKNQQMNIHEVFTKFLYRIKGTEYSTSSNRVA